MYAAVSKPVAATTSLPASGKWAGGPADGLRVAVPKKWVTVAPAARPGALDAVGLGRAQAGRAAARSCRAGAAPDR